MLFYDRIMLCKRSVVETINNLLKNIYEIEHTRHRSIRNFVMNLISALGAYCFSEKKPSIRFNAEPQPTGQPALFY